MKITQASNCCSKRNGHKNIGRKKLLNISFQRKKCKTGVDNSLIT